MVRRTIDRVRSWPFVGQAATLATIVAVTVHWRLLTLRVPLPTDVLRQTAAYPSDLPTSSAQHGNINDLLWHTWPLRRFGWSAVRAGDLPLWNPHLLMGAPFLADPQTALFYPPNWLFAVLPAGAAWGVLFPLRLVLSAVGAGLLARAVGASRLGALVAGIAYALCGQQITNEGLPIADAGVWLPYLLLGIHRTRQRPAVPAVLGVAFALAFVVLAGNPESAVFIVLGALAFATFRLFEVSAVAPTRYVLALAAAGALALGLAAVQWLPTVEWITHLSRLDRVVEAPFTGEPRQLNGLLWRDNVDTRYDLGALPSQSSAYLAALVLVAVPLAARHRNRRDAVFFAGLAVVSAAAAYEVWPVGPLMRALPHFDTAFLFRALPLTELALATLGALGITALQSAARANRARDRATWWAWGVGVVAVGIGVLTVVAHRRAGSDGWQGLLKGSASSVFLFVAAAVLCAPVVVRRLGPRFALAVVALVAVDHASYAYGHVPYAPRAAGYVAPPVLERLRATDPSVYRVVGLDGAYPPNAEMLFGHDAVGGYEFGLQDHRRFLEDVSVEFVGFFPTTDRVLANDDRRLDLLNLKYLVVPNAELDLVAAHRDRFQFLFTEGGVTVFENRRVMPRAFLVPLDNVVRVDDADAAFAEIERPGFDPATSAVVVSESPMFRAAGALTPTGPGALADAGAVSELREGADEVTLTLRASKDAVLVLSDMIYPGWTVDVDGRDSTLLRVDGGLRGVVVSPGEHRVTFRFEPASVRIGAVVSGISALVALGLGAAALRTARRASAARAVQTARRSGGDRLEGR